MGDPQSTVQAVLDSLVASGEEFGLQVTAYHHGAMVVDAWAGAADPASGRPVEPGTLFTVYSTSKGIAATAIHVLAERGTLDYDDPIARHWPEFARNGKDGVLIRHALSHTAGLPKLPPGTTQDDVTDWVAMCERVADLAPLWPPGQQLAYHSLTYGWIVGGVAERADGRSFATIVAEEIAAPLGLDGLYFGVPADALNRVATLVEAPDLLAAPPGPIPEAAPLGSLSAAQMNRAEVRRACLPAYGLCANARSLARVYAALIGDGVDGVRLVPPERVRQASALQVEGIDATGGQPQRFALGYSLGGPDSAAGPRRTAFGHRGYGGAYAYADPEYGLAVALTKNRLAPNVPYQDSTWRILHAVRESLGIPDAA